MSDYGFTIEDLKRRQQETGYGFTDQMNGEQLSAAVSNGTDGGRWVNGDTGHVSINTQPTVITLPYPPSANRYWRNVNGRMVKSAKARKYAKACTWAAIEQQQGQCLQGDVKITLRLYRPAKRGDLDNRIKVVLDSLQGIMYGDDKQISEIHAYRHEDKANPRVEITVEANER